MAFGQVVGIVITWWQVIGLIWRESRKIGVVEWQLLFSMAFHFECCHFSLLLSSVLQSMCDKKSDFVRQIQVDIVGMGSYECGCEKWVLLAIVPFASNPTD